MGNACDRLSRRERQNYDSYDMPYDNYGSSYYNGPGSTCPYNNNPAQMIMGQGSSNSGYEYTSNNQYVTPTAPPNPTQQSQATAGLQMGTPQYQQYRHTVQTATVPCPTHNHNNHQYSTGVTGSNISGPIIPVYQYNNSHDNQTCHQYTSTPCPSQSQYHFPNRNSYDATLACSGGTGQNKLRNMMGLGGNIVNDVIIEESSRDMWGNTRKEIIEERDIFGNRKEIIEERDIFGNQREIIEEVDRFGNNTREIIEECDMWGNRKEIIREKDIFGNQVTIEEDRNIFGGRTERITVEQEDRRYF